MLNVKSKLKLQIEKFDFENSWHSACSNKKISKDNKMSEKKAVLKKVGWFALKTTAISGAVLGGVAIAVPALGFTAGGVAAGSLAAAYQSAFLGGTVASGSAFAVLQSVGAAGLAASTQAAVVAASAATAGAHTVLKKLKRNNDAEAISCNCEKEKKVCTCSKIIEPNEKNEGGVKTCKCGKDKISSNVEVKDPNKCISMPKVTREDALSTDPESDDECDCRMEAIVPKNCPKKNDKSLKLETLNNSNDVLNEISSESIEKWKNLQLTDDVTITQHIFKKNKY